MPQAKRKKRKSSKTSDSSSTGAYGFGMLLVGMAVGAFAMYFAQGFLKNQSNVGSGIRNMIEQSKQSEQQQSVVNSKAATKPQQQKTDYDFFTILPEIEVVVAPAESKNTQEKQAEQSAQQPTTNQTQDQAEVKNDVDNTAYMLQAGSYKDQADAETRRATLALLGLRSRVQMVSIQGRGDFYRVRLGPYQNYQEMTEVDALLLEQGIKTLRLKVSKSG